MSRAKKGTKVAAQSQGPFEGTSSRADSSSASTSALAGPSSTTTSKRPRPASSDEQQQSQDPAKRSRFKPPQDNDDVDEDSVQPSSSAAAPIQQSRRRLLRIQRRNLVSGATNPAGGYAYLRLRVHASSSSSSSSIDASTLGETFRSTLSQHLGVVGGAVPFDVLSIHSPAPAPTQGTQGDRDLTRSSEALLRIPSQHAREVRAAIVLGGGARGGGAGAKKLRISLDGSQEETGSVWTLRPKGEGGAGWIKRMEEQLLAGGTA